MKRSPSLQLLRELTGADVEQTVRIPKRYIAEEMKEKEKIKQILHPAAGPLRAKKREKKQP